MLNFEYSIKINEDGRPYVYLPNTYIDKSEDKFMSLELSRYVLYGLISVRGEKLPPDQLAVLRTAYDTIGALSDELASLIKDQMEVLGESDILMNKNYHITVDTENDRDCLEYVDIVYNERLFKRIEGLRVLVKEDMSVYELVDGIDNINWKMK
jgi:hypothetical protein